MRSHRCLIACGWLVAVLWACGSNPRFSANAAGPPKDWKVLDGFLISVDVYARAAGSDKPTASTEEPKPIASYRVHAGLLPVLPFEECGCWKLQFGSFSKQPEFKDVYRLWIDKQNSHTRKASRFRAAKETPLPPASIAAIILDAPPGYPIELIPDVQAATIAIPRAGAMLEITSRAVEGGSERKAVLRANGKAEIEIRQRWLSGAKWWSEHERFYRGRRVLHARLLAPKTAPAAPHPAVSPPRSPVAVPPSAPTASSDLRADPRLQVRITADFQHRPLQVILDLLSRETHVPLKMEDSLAATVPQVGSSSLLHVPAWKVMQGLAHDFVKNGRWNKTSTGYELSASRAVAASPSPESDSRRRSWHVRLTLTLVQFVVVGILLFYLHLRIRKRSFPPASGAEERNQTANDPLASDKV